MSGEPLEAPETPEQAALAASIDERLSGAKLAKGFVPSELDEVFESFCQPMDLDDKTEAPLAPPASPSPKKPRVVPNIGRNFTPTGNVIVSKRGNKATRRLLRAEAKRAAAEARRQNR
jgi:hypothetical protein